MMKKWAFLLLFFLSHAFSAEWDESITYAKSTPPPLRPFAISGSYVDVSKAHFRTAEVEDSRLIYRQWESSLAYTHIFCPTWGLIFGAGWVGTEVNMENNPDFNQTQFNYVNFSIGAFTKALPDWTWTLTIAAFFDVEELSLIDFTLYQGVLWGKYNFCTCLELDFGLITEIGLSKDKVWPILGFVFTPYERLRLYAIYPINISLEYDLFKCVTAAASIRFLRNRHRLQPEEFNSQGIFEYHSTGGELDLIFKPFRCAMVKGFAGSTFGGDFIIADRNDKNSTHFKFKRSFYAGLSAIMSF